jgi:hypothetical protein
MTQPKPSRPRRTRRCAAASRQPSTARAQKLARGRKLLRDPNYPTSEVIQAVANVLARRLIQAQVTKRARLRANPKATGQA